MWTFLILVLPTVLFLSAVVLAMLFGERIKAARARLPHAPARSGQHDEAGPVSGLPDSPAGHPRSTGPPVAGDTCDRCATAAAAAAYLPGGRLLLCGHHGRQHRGALQAQGAVIVGELSFAAQRAAPGR